MTVQLYLVRHGETDWNAQRRRLGQTDVPLNEVGRQQAQALARRLRPYAFDAVYSSDLARARETAAMALPDLQPQLSPDLRELNFGIFEGLTYDEARSQHPQELADWEADSDHPPPQGESLSLLAQRVGRFLDHVQSVHADQHVLVVGHGGSLRLLICLALNLAPARQWSFQIDHASLSILSLYAGGATLTLLNDTAHVG